MSLEVASFLVGAFLLVAGVWGGGVTLKEVVVPELTGWIRGVSSLLGLFFVGLGVWLHGSLGVATPDLPHPQKPGGEYFTGRDTSEVYEGIAREFYCPEGLNMNSNLKKGISAFCISKGGEVKKGVHSGKNFKGEHKVYYCPGGSSNVESGLVHGIFAWCFTDEGTLMRARRTGGTYQGRHKVYSCPKGSVNLETGEGKGIAVICKRVAVR